MDIEQVADAIRAAIAVRHGVTVRDVLLTPAGAIPRTSSGKIGRSACRSAYLDGSLRSGRWQRLPGRSGMTSEGSSSVDQGAVRHVGRCRGALRTT